MPDKPNDLTHGHCAHYRLWLTETACRSYKKAGGAPVQGRFCRLNSRCRGCPGLDLTTVRVYNPAAGRLTCREERRTEATQ